MAHIVIRNESDFAEAFTVTLACDNCGSWSELKEWEELSKFWRRETSLICEDCGGTEVKMNEISLKLEGQNIQPGDPM